MPKTLPLPLLLNHESLMLESIHSIEIRMNVLPSSTSKYVRSQGCHLTPWHDRCNVAAWHWIFVNMFRQRLLLRIKICISYFFKLIRTLLHINIPSLIIWYIKEIYFGIWSNSTEFHRDRIISFYAVTVLRFWES